MAEPYQSFMLKAIWPYQVYLASSKSSHYGKRKQTTGRASDIWPIDEDVTSLSTYFVALLRPVWNWVTG